MSAADERDRAIRAAAAAPTKALLLARKVHHPSYRCQALAAVARFASEGEVVRVANEALRAAMLGKDGYARVAYAAWPVRALAERDKVQHAQQAIVGLLDEANRIDPPVSKAEALFLLCQAVWPLPMPARQTVLGALLAACRVADSWKAGRIMRDVALMVAADSREKAQGMINAMRESVYKRQAQKRLDTGQVEMVRSFFPGEN
jgi:hypothetical protein